MKLSVIMATYNETQQELTEAVESILTQTFSDFEFIIICDNPERTELVEWLEDFRKKDERVILIMNEKNLGVALSANKGIAIAKGEYIARMDADDISMSNRFVEQLDFIQNTDSDLIGTHFLSIDQDGAFLQYAEVVDDNVNIYKILPIRNMIHQPTVMMRTSVVKELGGYRDFRAAQDYDLWLRFLSSSKKIKIQNECLLKYRIRSTGISRTNRFRQILHMEYGRVLLAERINTSQSTDSFSVENLDNYLRKQGLFNDKVNKKVNENINIYEKGISLLKQKKLFGSFLVLNSVIRDKWTRKIFIRLLKYRLHKR